ncbi:MAG: PASTA domain-containing protein [Atopobiaceae bacterium]|nr:PASTA domain-containing protein [Atopobiaceae bacterium]
MRCPHCGTDNADDVLVCASCGASLEGGVTDADVDALMDQLPTVVAQRVEERTRHLSEALAEETQLLDNAGETKLIEDAAETQLLVDADETVLVEPSAEEDDAGESEPDEPAGDLTEPGIIPVDATILRPRAKQTDDDYLYVRNTRDYDHDAQSVNVAASSDRFATLREERPKREGRRDPYARSARKGDVLGEGNSRSKLRPLLALLLVILVLGGGGGVLTYGMELWGGKSVPGTVGESQANAEAMLSDKGFEVNVQAEPADDAIGKVLSQDPEAGTRLPEGSEVTIVVATNRTIPEVVGLSEEEARAKLAEAGAERIETKVVSSSEAEGTVLEVSPGAGEPFVSRSIVTLTVAGPYIVPDVVGKKEGDAVDAVKAAGLTPEVSYITSDKTVRTVVETSPAAGEAVGEGSTVQLKVSSPFPTDPMHLAEFFAHSSQDVDTYLQKQGYSFGKGFVDSYGNAIATYESDQKGKFVFSSQPYARDLALPKDGSSNVLSTGVPLAGVRLELAGSDLPSGYDEHAVKELMERCKFEGLSETITRQTISSGNKQTTAEFITASGKMGDLIWTVALVGNESTRRGVVTCAKEGLYSSSTLEPFGGSVAELVAYQEAYKPSEFQPKQEEKKDENKDGEEKKEGEEHAN